MNLQPILTQKQIECLGRGVQFGSLSPWDFGSTTIKVLKARGFIAKCAGASTYVVTDAGRHEFARYS